MEHHKIKSILIVSSYYPPHLGGLEIVAYNQAKRLRALGHKVTVVTSSTGLTGETGGDDGIEVVRVKVLNIFERWGVPFPIFSPRLIAVLFRCAKNADIVHVHDAFYLSSLTAVFCAYLNKKPVVLTQHVAMIPHPSRLVVFAQRLVYRTSGAVVFSLSRKIINLNDRVAKFLMEMGVPAHKLIALPNGVDTETFRPAGTGEKRLIRENFRMSPDKKIVLFVGRFVPKKGYDKLLAARSEEYQLVFAGGEGKGDFGPDVVFLGKLSTEMLSQVYRAADIFILPSEGEGFPLTIQEAMSSGLPIITTNDPGYARYNLDRKLVILIDKPAEKSIREALGSIINDEERLKNMAEYSREYALVNFSWPFVISKFNELYDDLLADKK